MNFMNSVFCYRTSCPIDICQFHDKHSSFLKRASSLTNGMYVRATSSKSLYGLLSYYFLSEVEVRKEMIIPHEILNTSVPCSCHGKPIQNDQAYICTVCLSILCKHYDKCPIHSTSFSVSRTNNATQPSHPHSPSSSPPRAHRDSAPPRSPSSHGPESTRHLIE